MRSVGTVVVENHWRAIDIFDDHVDFSVIVEIAKSRAAACLRDRHGRSHNVADIGECAIPLVQEHKFALAVLRAGNQRVDLGIYMAINHEQIGPSVIVEVDASRAPAHVGECDLSDAGRVGDVGKGHVAVVAIERITLVLEIRNVNRKASGVIEVADGDSHSCHLTAITADRSARNIADI